MFWISHPSLLYFLSQYAFLLFAVLCILLFSLEPIFKSSQLPAAPLPEDNGKLLSEAAVTGSDKAVESREAETSDGKGKSSGMQHCQNVTFREYPSRSIKGGIKWQCMKRDFSSRTGRIHLQTTTWNTCFLLA